MNEQTLNALLAHPLATTAAVIAALGAFFALTANFVKTVDVIKGWLKGKNECEREPTKADVRDAGVPSFGQTSSFGQNFWKGAAAAGFGVYAVDAAGHAVAHSSDVASSFAGHLDTISEQVAHPAIVDHAMNHADSIGDLLSGIVEAFLG